MYTKQQRLIMDIATDIDAILKTSLARRVAVLTRVLYDRVNDLADCPQDRETLIQSLMIFRQLVKRYGGTMDLTGLEILFTALDDDYKAEFEEELYESMADLSDTELKWIAQYSRNDKPVCDLAAEVLDRRSGV